MLPTAHIVHRLRGRFRLKIPEKRTDADWLAEAASRLERVPGVKQVEVRVVSGSLLIRHQTEAGLEERLAAAGLFRITDDLVASPPVLDPILDGISRSHRKLERRTGGRANLSTILIVLLVLAAFVQTLRGQILPPTVSLLWYAATLAIAAKNREQELP